MTWARSDARNVVNDLTKNHVLFTRVDVLLQSREKVWRESTLFTANFPGEMRLRR